MNRKASMILAVIALMNARKKGSQNAPCGVAAPRQSTTGKCEAPQRIPSSTLATSGPRDWHILGKAKPIHPISSKNAAARPKEMPSRKRLGL